MNIFFGILHGENSRRASSRCQSAREGQEEMRTTLVFCFGRSTRDADAAFF